GRRRWRLRDVDGGIDDGRSPRSAGQDHSLKKQQPRRSEIRAGGNRQSRIWLRTSADRLCRFRACLRCRRIPLRTPGRTAPCDPICPAFIACGDRGSGRGCQREADQTGCTESVSLGASYIATKAVVQDLPELLHSSMITLELTGEVPVFWSAEIA